ncbi:Hypothetical predicted protein [Marmota monax]|uniref:Uncharacterized protein n=1 Tax=Marmota monax TaxID=9995 RepID=A0A5E4CLE4_MARMO|nr:Hypothetical predicted protein [Marmota monax]
MASQRRQHSVSLHDPVLDYGNFALLRVIEDPSTADPAQESWPPCLAGLRHWNRTPDSDYLPTQVSGALAGPPASAPAQNCQTLIPSRTLSRYPHSGTSAATPVWTPIYQRGALPVASILGLNSYCHSPLLTVACLHLGTSCTLKKADSCNTAQHRTHL